MTATINGSVQPADLTEGKGKTRRHQGIDPDEAVITPVSTRNLALSLVASDHADGTRTDMNRRLTMLDPVLDAFFETGQCQIPSKTTLCKKDDCQTLSGAPSIHG